MLLITLLVLLATSAMAQPLPPLDSGICPLGYIREASYCVPTSPRRAVAIPKVGECPSGYAQLGPHYCVEVRPQLSGPPDEHL
jgi:hypothetical protein